MPLRMRSVRFRLAAVRSTVKVNGGQVVSYVDHGGSGPAVLLLHSYLMDADMFAPQVRALGDAFRLIAMNARGHGDTRIDGAFTYVDLARDALGLLDALGVVRCAVVGVSEGGVIAIYMALLAPDRVAALALLGVSGAAEEPEMGLRYWEAALAWEKHGPTQKVLDLNARICMGEYDATERQTKWRRLPPHHAVRVLIPVAKRDGMQDQLPQIHCPALILHGSADAVYPVDRAHELAEKLPNAEPPVVIEGGAHFLSLTDADAVNPHLRAFLDRTLRPA
jgi:pimeloyl-ACP methyl ester carboxylesterase